MEIMATTAPVLQAHHDVPWWQRNQTKIYFFSLLFVLPALINFTVFRYIPIIYAIRASFWQYSLVRGFEEMIGFDNYVRAVTNDPIFWDALRATTLYVIGKVPLQASLALALALFTNQQKPFMGLARGLIFVPVVTSYVVVSIVWGLVLNEDLGLLNSILRTIGIPAGDYLTNPNPIFVNYVNKLPEGIRHVVEFILPNQTLATIIGLSIWKDVGYSTIILVAGLKGIPDVYYEAAIVDGANGWQRFVNITIPLLRRPLLFVIVTTTLFAFQVFVPVYQLTKGGPGRSTMVLVYYIYRQGFNMAEMGYASALSIILLLIVLCISVLQMYLLRPEDD